MRLLDRYVLRSFLEPFLICFSAFLGILLVFDLYDNMSDFVGAKAKWKLVGAYYLHQLPHFVLLSMPVGLLLALLYSLSRMSRSNEIISMLATGRSVLRLLLPLFACGLIATGLCLWLNYELAPQSTSIRKADLERITKGDKRADRLSTQESVLVKDRRSNRIWFIRKVDLSEKSDRWLHDVNIVQLDPNGQPQIRWQAQVAAYEPREGRWYLNKGRKIEYDESGSIIGDLDDWSQDLDKLNVDEAKARGYRQTRTVTWPETPNRIMSTLLQPDQMSVPALRTYLRDNPDFPATDLAKARTNLHHRFALPVACFAVVLIASALGIVFSRRAVLASVAGSLFLFFGYLFIMYLLMALGKDNLISPVMAAWLPDALLAAIGCYLLYLRSTNREFPKLLFWRK